MFIKTIIVMYLVFGVLYYIHLRRKKAFLSPLTADEIFSCVILWIIIFIIRYLDEKNKVEDMDYDYTYCDKGKKDKRKNDNNFIG